MKQCSFYTTVTLSDFEDVQYINQLIKLNIGLELALLTKLSNNLNLAQYERDLDALKKEITAFKSYFSQFNIPLENIRVHQPGGYTYDWSHETEKSGFDFLKEFFSYCYDLGFRNFVIHAPYGNSLVNSLEELNDYREKLSTLLPDDARLEVEEISVSHNDLENTNIRVYKGDLLEKLIKDQKAKILLDTYECGGIKETMGRLKELKSKGFEIKSIHLHKDKHKFLTSDEVGLLLQSNFSGNLINEGFLQDESSFDEFVKTKSINCVMPNNQRIEILKKYIEQISN